MKQHMYELRTTCSHFHTILKMSSLPMALIHLSVKKRIIDDLVDYRPTGEEPLIEIDYILNGKYLRTIHKELCVDGTWTGNLVPRLTSETSEKIRIG